MEEEEGECLNTSEIKDNKRHVKGGPGSEIER